MCTEPGGQTVACLRLIWDESSVQDHWRAEGGWHLTHMRCPMCTEPGGQTVASSGSYGTSRLSKTTGGQRVVGI